MGALKVQCKVQGVECREVKYALLKQPNSKYSGQPLQNSRPDTNDPKSFSGRGELLAELERPVKIGINAPAFDVTRVKISHRFPVQGILDRLLDEG